MLRSFSFAALTLFLLGGIAVPQQTTTGGSGSATYAGTASKAPVIQVYTGTLYVPDSGGIANGTGTFDLGTAPVAKVKPTVFTVRNAGTADLTLAAPIRLPRGFTLVRSFGAHQLAPGQSTTFVVALNSAGAGKLNGKVSFGTNGVVGQKFSFTITGTAQGPPSLRIVDNTDPDFRTAGSWTVVNRGFQGTARIAAGGQGNNQAVWTFRGLRSGRYQLAATWPVADGQASNAQFILRNGTKTFSPIVLNQGLNPSSFRDAGTTWQKLGEPVHLHGDTLSVSLSDQANGAVVADAVRLERVGYPGKIVVPGGGAFQSVGGWAQVDTHVLQSTQNGSWATWTFTGLTPGRYRISTTFPASSKASAAALFAILDGDRATTQMTLNQQQAPHDLRDAGANWADLGGADNLFTVAGSKLMVRLSASKDGSDPGYVLAGPMRIERIYDHGHGGGGPLIDQPDVVRFLEQSTWGPNDSSINHFVNDLGADPVAFLNEQFNAPISSYSTPPLVLDNQTNQCAGDTACNRDNYSLYPVQNRFYVNAMYGPDQLRQRVAFALHEIDVVSGIQINIPMRYVPYLKIFDNNAFGNYRDVLGQITLNPAMGVYLNMVTSTKASPNENYAREIMQLFSVGLNFLNPDGTLQLDNNGNPIPTYTQDTVVNVAKAFTGWTYQNPPQTGTTNFIDPMKVRTPETTYHNRDQKTLLQYPNAVNPVLPPNQPTATDLNQALDNIFYHPNVGPFITNLLIQKLVTSNPSPGYVARAESAFEDDGTGTRGNLWAVIQAILLDPEARGDSASDPNFGHLREPVLYTCNILRAFNATSHDGTTTSIGYINPTANPMGMDLFRPPTVFSYYPPDFTIPTNASILGPEFGVLTTVTTLKRANFVQTMCNPNGGVGNDGIKANTNSNTSNYDPTGTALNWSYLQTLTPDAMADYLNVLLLHRTMSDPMRTQLIQAINAVAASNPLKRAKTAAYLVLTSPQYQVQR
jgi:uncharacterized protein (DUF1800 family)